MKKFTKEFKEFILKGDVLSLAVAVMIGAAFQTVVTSLSTDIISPIIGIFGSTDLSQYSVTVNGSTITYGTFITSIINFIIMGLVIFLFVKFINKSSDAKNKALNKKKEEAAPTTKKCPFCFSEIDIKATRCPHCTSVIEDNAA